MLKLAIVSYEFPPHNGTGGVAFYSYNLAQLLSESCLVYVFSGADLGSKSIYEQSKINNFISIVVNCKSSSDFIYKVVNIFKYFHQQIIFDIIESPEVGACALEIKKTIPSLPLIIKLHTPVTLLGEFMLKNSPLFFKVKWFLKSLFKLNLKYTKQFFTRDIENDNEFKIIQIADTVYSPSIELALELKNMWKISDKIKIIDNYYPLRNQDAIVKLITTKMHNLNFEINICFIGKQTFMKGADIIYNIIQSLNSLNLKYCFTIIAEDMGDLYGRKYTDKFNKIIKESGNKIRILSRLPNSKVIDQLEKSHILVVPSLWENQPTVIWEAINSGCVVLANNIGGIKSMIKNSENGFLINNNCISEYVEIINKIYKGNITYEKISKLAFENLSYRMQEDKIRGEIINLYNSTLS